MRNCLRNSRRLKQPRESGMRQGWMPNGQDRAAGLVNESLARSEAEGDAQTRQALII